MKTLYTLICVMAITFAMAQTGIDCTSPDVISSVPYTQTGMTTEGSLNDYTSTACGGTYMDGEDYVFTFTPAMDITIDIQLTNTGLGVGLFVLDACPDATPNCIAFAEAMAGNPSLTGVALTSGITYYIIVSTYDIFGGNPNTAFDIQITKQIDYDGGVVAILSPSSNCNLSDSETVTIEIANFGMQTIENFDVAYSFNGNPAVVETTSLSILPGETGIYSFSASVDGSATGSYSLNAWTLVVDDEIDSNDTTYYNFVSSPIIDFFPYDVDFETEPHYWAASGNNSTWSLGSPTGTLINYSIGGSNAWVTNLSGNHATSEVSFLESPCFDFSSLTKPRLDFNLWHELTFFLGNATMEYSLDYGISWDTLKAGTMSNNWYGMSGTWSGSSADWLEVANVVPDLGGQSSVKFRINLNGGLMAAEGVAFDNFTISDCLTPDPVADFSYTVDTTTVVFTNLSTGADSYAWSFGDFIGSSTEENPQHTYILDGSYDVTLTVSNECGSASITYTVGISTGFSTFENSNISIYPNPVKNFININECPDNAIIQLVDSNGRILIEQEASGNNAIINVSHLPASVYFVRISDGKDIFISKIVK
ncbi:MAG: T9SS type A sorting domain-containing protein [Bacteroidales bacterium]|nr:T9SS type A sorting domain-containing protein [Bacteroidales bacterium]